MLGLIPEQRKLYDNLQNAIKSQGDVADLFKGVSKDDLLKVLTTANIIVKFQNGVKCIITPLGFAIELNDQQSIKAILDAARKQVILEKVLITANIIMEFPGVEKHTVTPLGFAIELNDQQSIKAILDAAAKEKDILQKALTTANITEEFLDGQEYTVTPLGFAISFNDQQSIKTILDAARKQGILEKVLITANIITEFPGGEKDTVTPLAFAISLKDQEISQKGIEAILGAAREQDILKEVFAVIKKCDLEKIKTIAKEAGDQDILDKILEVEKSIESEATKANPPSDESATQSPKNKAKTTNKPIIIGGVCGVIAALAVGGGCFAANVELSTLAIAGVAVAVALAVGLAAYGIACAVLKPSNKLEEANAQQQEQGERGPLNQLYS